MEEIKNLIAESKYKEALLLLQTQLKEEDKNTAILLLGEFNNYHESLLRNTEPTNPARLNNIMYRVLQLCDKHDSIAKNKIFAEPPILDNLPLDKEGYLLGRKAALEQLHTSLQSKNILTLVNGMGGIGKSTLASFYANFPEYKAAYSHCFWVSVSDLTGEVKEALINAFAEALALYQIPQKEQLAKIQTYLSGLQGQTLLILDNANDKKKVTEALDFLRKCKIKVLFTSRANMNNIPSQALAKLLAEDAFTLFTHYFPAAAAMPETPQLLKNIDYHTLLTEFMAKSLAHNPVLSLQDLVEITQQQNFTDELLAYTQFTSYHTHTHKNPDVEIHPAEYLLQIFPIQNLSEQEQEILRYFSILPTEWIEMEMLKQLFIFNPSNLKNNHKGVLKFILNILLLIIKFFYPNQKKEELELGAILQSLYEKGWLQKSPTNAFACHILLQHLLRQQLKPNAKNCMLLLKNLESVTHWDSYTNLLTLAPYLPFVTTVLSWIKDETKLISDIYHSSAAIYEATGNYAQALSYNLENVRIKEKILAADDADLATAYNNIANTYEKLGDYQKALEYGLKALSIYKKVLSAEHSDLATSYNNIASIYYYLGDYQKSLEYGLKALSIREKALSTEPPSLAASYNNISVTYKKLGDYQKALEYNLKAVSIYEKALSVEHPHLTASYNNIALTYSSLGDYQKALKYDLKALSIRKKVLSAEHPDLATSYDNIGVTYSYLGDREKEVKYKLKALSIREKILSAEHPDLASSYHNIGISYQYLGDYQKSLEYGLKDLAICEKILSAEHPDLANSYYNIAITYYYLKDYDTAYSYIQKAVSIFTKVLPKEHPHIQLALDKKAMIEKAMRGE